MKRFEDFTNENRTSKKLKDKFADERRKAQLEYEERRKPFNALIEPIENYVEETFNIKEVEAKIYKEDMFQEDLFTISLTVPFPDTYAIDDIQKCIESTSKNVETLKGMKKLEEVFGTSYSSNNYISSTHNRFKFYVPMEMLVSNFFKSISGMNKFKI